jgi:hypothetical protein
MPVKTAKKAKPKKKLTSRQRSLRMKKVWAAKKASALKAEEATLFNSPTMRKARVEDDGPIEDHSDNHHQSAPSLSPGQSVHIGNLTAEKRYYVSHGGTIIDFNNGPLRWADMLKKVEQEFNTDPRMDNIMILEVTNIRLKKRFKLTIADAHGGKEETLTLNE